MLLNRPNFPATFCTIYIYIYAVKGIVSNFLSRLLDPHFRSSMANAAAKILRGLGEKSLNDGHAQDFFDWMGDLTGTGTDSDASLDRVSEPAILSLKL